MEARRTMQTRRFPSRIDAPAPEAPLRTVVVGYGYWGPNLVRNVIERPEFELRRALRARPGRAARPSRPRSPGIPVISDLDEVLDDPTVDAVIVATPPHTHHAICKAALLAGKHVLVEKPLATTTMDALDLVDTADTRDVLLMPGHTFLYSPPVRQGPPADRPRRARRDVLRHVVAHEPGQVPERRRHLRPRAARPLDPAALARGADRAGRGVGPLGVPEPAFPRRRS